MERIVTPQIRTILVKIAMFMRKNAPAAAQDAAPEIAMPAAAAAAGTRQPHQHHGHREASAAGGNDPLANAATPTTLGPREVEQILELGVGGRAAAGSGGGALSGTAGDCSCRRPVRARRLGLR